MNGSAALFPELFPVGENIHGGVIDIGQTAQVHVCFRAVGDIAEGVGESREIYEAGRTFEDNVDAVGDRIVINFDIEAGDGPHEFERDNIHFESALNYCPELLVKHGFLTRRKPTPAQWTDIRFGWEMAKEMGRLDIGQSVIVNDTAVIAVEAIEGTDQCIRRAGELCRRGFTVVKVAKPQQDLRFDVPTVGLKTIQTMHEAGGRVLAIEAGMTIFLDQQEVIDLADKLGIAVVSVKAEEMALRIAG